MLCFICAADDDDDGGHDALKLNEKILYLSQREMMFFSVFVCHYKLSLCTVSAAGKNEKSL